MDPLPLGCVLVRTWFGNDEAWEQLKVAVDTPSEDGFLATVRVVEDRSYEGLDSQTLAALTSHDKYGALVSFLADETTLTSPDLPILVVWVLPPVAGDDREFPPFRVIPSQLWSVENNLNLANMDWVEFYRWTGPDGVFRGFAD
jgi:hypothetical protein